MAHRFAIVSFLNYEITCHRLDHVFLGGYQLCSLKEIYPPSSRMPMNKLASLLAAPSKICKYGEKSFPSSLTNCTKITINNGKQSRIHTTQVVTIESEWCREPTPYSTKTKTRLSCDKRVFVLVELSGIEPLTSTHYRPWALTNHKSGQQTIDTIRRALPDLLTGLGDLLFRVKAKIDQSQ